MSKNTIHDLEITIQSLKEELEELYQSAEPKPVSDYTFQKPDGSEINLSALFNG